MASVAGLLGDIRVSIRSLRRTPAFWLTVASTLALGIGVNAAIFSIVRSVLWSPLVNRGEERLIYIQQSEPRASARRVPSTREWSTVPIFK